MSLCEGCGEELINDCWVCGAPVCCPECCGRNFQYDMQQERNTIMRTREELLAERTKIDAELQLLDRREVLQKVFGNMGALVDAMVADPRLGYELSYEQCITVHTKNGVECRVFPVAAEVDLAEKPDSSVIKLNVEIYF